MCKDENGAINQAKQPQRKQPAPRHLEHGQFHVYKLRTTPTDATSPIYKLLVSFFDEGTPEEWIKFWHRLQTVLKRQNVTQGPPSYTVTKTLLKGDVLTVFKQAENDHSNQTVPQFNLCLDDMAAHVFPEKARQTQKCYMRRNICFGKGITTKEWVAQVLELNGYLKDFPVHNGDAIQPLDKDTLLDTLEYRVPAS
eukprot:6066078-Ditylum_brightwellii.AAC.1